MVVLDLSGNWFEVLAVEEVRAEPRRLFLTAEASPWPERCEARLTRLERQVASLLALRASNTEIASRLGISAHTARRHTERILEKLNCRSRQDVRDWLSRSSALPAPRSPGPADKQGQECPMWRSRHHCMLAACPS